MAHNQPMARQTSQEDASLLDVLVDGFEKNEVIDGFHWRQLPMSDADAAVRKFISLTQEARRWKGEPGRLEEGPMRRIASWPELEIRQAGTSRYGAGACAVVSRMVARSACVATRSAGPNRRLDRGRARIEVGAA
jgi:hypothetical protein